MSEKAREIKPYITWSLVTVTALIEKLDDESFGGINKVEAVWLEHKGNKYLFKKLK